jgi:hypothetical protein
MDQYEKDEFWKGLTRLYDATVKLEAASVKLEVSTNNLREIAVAHESRLDKIEVVQQWLAEKERAREKRERGEE